MDQLVLAVKELRLKLGDSQAAFANRLGLSIKAIANYEGGRHPSRAVLWGLTMLASETNYRDLATLFSQAHTEAMKGKIRPITEEESAWVRMILALLRHRKSVPDLQQLGKTLLAALEIVVSKAKATSGIDCEELEESLLWASNHIAPTGERKARQLAAERSKQTGESVTKAYLQTLLDNPELYAAVRKEAAEAHGLPPADIVFAGIEVANKTAGRMKGQKRSPRAVKTAKKK